MGAQSHDLRLQRIQATRMPKEKIIGNLFVTEKEVSITTHLTEIAAHN